METDNECYREFLVEEELLATAMSEANTLAFHAFAMEIRTLHEMNQLYTVKNWFQMQKRYVVPHDHCCMILFGFLHKISIDKAFIEI